MPNDHPEAAPPDDGGHLGSFTRPEDDLTIHRPEDATPPAGPHMLAHDAPAGGAHVHTAASPAPIIWMVLLVMAGFLLVGWALFR